MKNLIVIPWIDADDRWSLVPVFIIPFFFLIILVVQYVGSEINEEKDI